MHKRQEDSWQRVYFRSLGPEQVLESARVLRPGGRLVIHTGTGIDAGEVTAAMRRAGFKYVKVTSRGFVRIAGRLRGAK